MPRIGELVGGSVREERYEVLQQKMTRAGALCDCGGVLTIAGLGPHYQWYLDLRRHGSAPHAGFGLGLERFLLFATGMLNIRDVVPFPRVPGGCPM